MSLTTATPHPALHRAMPARVSVFLLLVAISIGTVSRAGTVVVEDGEFSDADWTVQAIVCPPSGSSSAVLQEGGNPGAYREVTNSLSSSGYSNAMSVHVYDPFSIDPAATGGIEAFDLHAEFRCRSEDGCFGQGAAFGLVVQQDGHLFLGGVEVTGVGSDWVERTSLDIQSNHFYRIDTAACPGDLTFGDLTPDLSSTGSPIQIGFALWNSGANYTLSGGIDNWSVNVHPSPTSTAAEAAARPGTGVDVLRNPVGHSPRFALRLEESADVRLEIYSVGGRLIRSLVSREFPQGNHQVEWNRRDDHGTRVSTGVYFLLARIGSEETRLRFVVLK